MDEQSGSDSGTRRRGRPRKTTDGGDTSDRGGIQSLERAAVLLSEVAAHPAGISLAELSTKAGLHNSTAFHLTKTLVALGFIDQELETRRYRIGPRIFALAASALEEKTLLAFSKPLLERLSASTGEASHLAIRSGHEIVIVARTAATGLLTLSQTGALRPPHATAIGKALMAAMPDDELNRMLEAIDKPRFTAATLTNTADLSADIARVRAEGMAHDRGELDSDVRCIAVQVQDFSGRTIAAMGISGPVWRMGEAQLPQKAAQLKAAALELSTLLGGASA